MKNNPEFIINGILSGDRAVLARGITIVENSLYGAEEIISQIEEKTGHAFILGITGPPGAGKSTFTSSFVTELRKQNLKIGIIAVDPSSPFTGGAVLGDRIRMRVHTKDENVFMRSLGSRGALGGLSLKTSRIVSLMDAFGMDVIIVETVGVGQSETEISKTADMTAVILAPGFGDDIQALKAGILEIADIFIVNKSDLAGADKLELELKQTLKLNYTDTSIPVIKCCSTRDDDFANIYSEIKKRVDYFKQEKILDERRLNRKRRDIYDLIKSEIEKITEEKIQKLGGIDSILNMTDGKVYLTEELKNLIKM